MAATLTFVRFVLKWLRRERQLLSPPVNNQTRKKPRVSVSKRAGLQVFIVATDKIA